MITLESVRFQLLRVTKNVLVILPVRPKEPLHTLATGFRNVNKDASILVDEHRVLDIYNIAANICGNGKEVGTHRTLMVCIYNESAIPEATNWLEALNSPAVKYAAEGDSSGRHSSVEGPNITVLLAP